MASAAATVEADGAGGVKGTALGAVMGSVLTTGGWLPAAVTVSDTGNLTGVGSLIVGFWLSAKHLW